MGNLLREASGRMPDVEVSQVAGVFAPVSRVHLFLALTGIILPLLALSMEQGFAISALPRAIADLNGFDHYAWSSTSFLLTSTVAMPVVAKLSDLYGRKWFHFFSAVLSVAYPIFSGAAGTLPILLDGMNQIVIASGLAGLAHGGIIVLSFTLVAVCARAAARRHVLSDAYELHPFFATLANGRAVRALTVVDNRPGESERVATGVARKPAFPC